MSATRSQLVLNDPYLEPFEGAINGRNLRAETVRSSLIEGHPDLVSFAQGHQHFGLHFRDGQWQFRDWAPNLKSMHLIGDFNGWKIHKDYACHREEGGCWALDLPQDWILHSQLYRLSVTWDGGEGERIPAWVRRTVQDENDKSFSAQVWSPDTSYAWKHNCTLDPSEPALIYEAHVGMAQEESKVGSYVEFRDRILPRIAKAGYNTIQLMAIQEHPYYGSFGYHVSSLFAVSSRFGTPEELKSLIDEAHGLGLRVIMDLVHSHAVKNELEGISCYDGTSHQFFHDGVKGEHVAWDSRCYDYGKPEVLHFLLSNCRFWLEEYRFDGYRFDGVTSMLYYDHGLEKSFSAYADYFDGNQDGDAIAYLKLANEVIHEFNPQAITVAEEMSGMPGIATDTEEGGMGFDYRLAMGVPDYWIKMIKEKKDQEWNVSEMFHELTNKRMDEQVIGYVESHDQALVGDKTVIFRLIDKEMYDSMSKGCQSLVVDRGLALHKMIRLLTLSTCGHGYLNFMGNEFGHPEWIDFPREGNDWSCHHARRQWSLRDADDLRYKGLADFDEALLSIVREKKLFLGPNCFLITSDDDRQLLSFRRGEFIFAFNFHPSESWTDVELSVPQGTYQLVLDTDQSMYEGFGRLDATRKYHTVAQFGQAFDGNVLKCYLPARSGLVFLRELN
jgi:1,4-alpha-glucan branching enzyme